MKKLLYTSHARMNERKITLKIIITLKICYLILGLSIIYLYIYDLYIGLIEMYNNYKSKFNIR